MDKLYYCVDCKRVLTNDSKCDYCNSENINELKMGKSVNVIDTKLKGKALKVHSNNVKLLLRDELNNKYLKDYTADKLRKIL